MIFWCILVRGPSGMDGMRWNERRAIYPPFAPLHSFRKANRMRGAAHIPATSSHTYANTHESGGLVRTRVQYVWSVSLKRDAECCYNELAAGRWKQRELACIVCLCQMKYNQSESPRPTSGLKADSLPANTHFISGCTGQTEALLISHDSQWVYTHFKTNSTLY